MNCTENWHACVGVIWLFLKKIVIDELVAKVQTGPSIDGDLVKMCMSVCVCTGGELEG